jgi:hypothetical protein
LIDIHILYVYQTCTPNIVRFLQITLYILQFVSSSPQGLLQIHLQHYISRNSVRNHMSVASAATEMKNKKNLKEAAPDDMRIFACLVHSLHCIASTAVEERDENYFNSFHVIWVEVLQAWARVGEKVLELVNMNPAGSAGACYQHFGFSTTLNGIRDLASIHQQEFYNRSHGLPPPANLPANFDSFSAMSTMANTLNNIIGNYHSMNNG